LLYKGSRDGFRASKFHQKCDKRSPTITFIKSQIHGRVFGGYTEQTWDGSPGSHKSDNRAFLFSLTHNEKYPVVQHQYAICTDSTFCCVFGMRQDICIYDNCNTVADSSRSRFPISYKCAKFDTETDESKAYLAGSYNFKVEEIEVYQITWT